jgi:hypothetical protein
MGAQVYTWRGRDAGVVTDISPTGNKITTTQGARVVGDRIAGTRRTMPAGFQQSWGANQLTGVKG